MDSVCIYQKLFFGALDLSTQLQKTAFDKYTHYPFIEFGVEKIGGLVQHHITTIIGYDFYKKMGYAGVKAKIMVSDILGFDIRYFNSINFQNYNKNWRSDSYLVFSPVLRINY